MKRFLLLLVWILFLSNFLFAWSVWHVLSGGKRIDKNKSEIILSIARIPSEFYHELFLFLKLSSSGLSVPNIEYQDGFFVKNPKVSIPKGYVLISTVNKSNGLCEIQLIDLLKKKVIKVWQPDYNKINLGDFSKFHTRLLHPIFIGSSELLVNFNDKLSKLDSNSRIVWQISAITHHSIEIDAEHFVWTCGTIVNSPKNKIKNLIRDDSILKIDPNGGSILFQKSIYDLLMENGYQNLFYYLGPMNDDPLHVNDVQPALSTTKYWRKGDLLVSLRHRSTVFLYRPSTNKVIWLKTGPWTYQHDCDFLNDHEIGVFGNDVVRVESEDVLINGHNNQYIYNFETDQVTTPYTKMFQEGKIKTLTEGRSRILPDGQLFVEESNYGRILFGDTNGLNGGYVGRIDKNHVAMLGWSRFYTINEFNEINKKTK